MEYVKERMWDEEQTEQQKLLVSTAKANVFRLHALQPDRFIINFKVTLCLVFCESLAGIAAATLMAYRTLFMGYTFYLFSWSGWIDDSYDALKQYLRLSKFKYDLDPAEDYDSDEEAVEHMKETMGLPEELELGAAVTEKTLEMGVGAVAAGVEATGMIGEASSELITDQAVEYLTGDGILDFLSNISGLAEIMEAILGYIVLVKSLMLTDYVIQEIYGAEDWDEELDMLEDQEEEGEEEEGEEEEE
jgi:hypothetical protein